jgi:hypothetical protein
MPKRSSVHDDSRSDQSCAEPGREEGSESSDDEPESHQGKACADPSEQCSFRCESIAQFIRLGSVDALHRLRTVAHAILACPPENCRFVSQYS